MTEELASSLPLIPLAQNPHLPPNVVEWIAERALDLIVDHVGFPSRYAGDHLTNATSALGELARAGHLIPKQQIERLVQETNAQGFRSGHCINAIKEIGAQVSTDQLETVFEISAPHHWKKLINHPSNTIELQKKAG